MDKFPVFKPLDGQKSHFTSQRQPKLKYGGHNYLEIEQQREISELQNQSLPPNQCL